MGRRKGNWGCWGEKEGTLGVLREPWNGILGRGKGNWECWGGLEWGLGEKKGKLGVLGAWNGFSGGRK